MNTARVVISILRLVENGRHEYKYLSSTNAKGVILDGEIINDVDTDGEEYDSDETIGYGERRNTGPGHEPKLPEGYYLNKWVEGITDLEP